MPTIEDDSVMAKTQNLPGRYPGTLTTSLPLRISRRRQPPEPFNYALYRTSGRPLPTSRDPLLVKRSAPLYRAFSPL